MKQFNLFSMVLCSAVAPQAVFAQAPSLEQKQTLPTQLLTKQSYSSDWGSTKPEPVSKGWTLLDGSNNEVDKWPNARFEKSPSMKLSYADGTVYTGNFFLIRWDGGLKNKSYKYMYAVSGLKANTTYRLSMDCAYWNNDDRTTFMVGVSKESTGANSISSKDFKSKGIYIQKGKKFVVK